MATNVTGMEMDGIIVEPGGDGKSHDGPDDAETPRSPERSVRSASRKTTKCAYCRKDHKKCVRTSDNAKCERCKSSSYPCFGGLEAANASSPKRVLNRQKCDFCREAKQKCLPVNRRWPSVCDRCHDRGLPCSEPGSAKKKRRPSENLNKSAPESTDYLQTEIYTETHRHSRSVERIPQHSGYLETEIRTETRSRSRSVNRLPQSTDHLGTATFSGVHLHQPSRSVQSAATNQATPPETPQAWGDVESSWLGPGANPSDEAISGSGLLSGMRGEDPRVEDATNLAMLSQAAGRFDSTIPFQQPQSATLCNQCALIHLSQERFIVEDRQNRRRRPMSYGLSHREDEPWSAFAPRRTAGGNRISSQTVELGKIEKIRSKCGECPFCRLVFRSAQDQIPSHRLLEIDTVTAYASWLLDGRELLSGEFGKTPYTKPRTRRIRLHWSKQTNPHPLSPGPILNDAFIVLMNDPKFTISGQFLGRPIDSGRSTISLTKDWVRQCQCGHEHENEVTPQEDFFRDVINVRRFRLLDVADMRMVRPEKAAPLYVALSYVRVPKQNDMLAFADFVKSTTFGAIDRSKLPRTVQDTITLVKALDLRYLWVDILCTVFDENGKDWNHSIMDQIFGNSFLTICAADNPDANAGLVAMHYPRKPVVQHIELCSPDLHLMVSHPSETYIKRSKWFTRAWTFQERFLAKRCLIFCEGRVWFQCRDAAVSEDIVENLTLPSWSVDMLHTPSQTLGNFKDPMNAIRAYMTCVESYTLRQFTWSEDILVAFEGLSKMIGKSLNTDVIFGLPSAFLDLTLLWELDEAPRKERKPSSIQKFPSWSWSHWEGSITYRASTLSGILNNIPSWLSTHTWISWYVRDRYNIPRLLHKSGQGPTTVKPEVQGKMVKEEVKHQIIPGVALESYTQHPVRWPELNRSAFFKSVPNLQIDVMDVDSDLPEDLKLRDTEYLQFWTWSAYFRLNVQRLSTISNLSSSTGLSRFGILDYNDDFCGTIILPDHYNTSHGENSVHEFIAISEAKDFAPDELDAWTYYMPQERDAREWDLWYVLLVEKVDNVVVKRAGLGKVFVEAFENSHAPGKDWREFIMA